MEKTKLEILGNLQQFLDVEGVPLIKTETEIIEAKKMLTKMKGLSDELKGKLEHINHNKFIKANEKTVCLHLHGMGIAGIFGIVFWKNPIIPMLCIIAICCLMILINLFEFKRNSMRIKQMINPGNILGLMEKGIQEAEKRLNAKVPATASTNK
jgi:hypothetical protein